MCRPVVTHHWRCNHNTTLAATICDTHPCTFTTAAFVRPGSPLCGECRQPDSAFRRAAAAAEAEARYVAQAMMLPRYGTRRVQRDGRDTPRAEAAPGATRARERGERVGDCLAAGADDRLVRRREGLVRLSEIQESERERERPFRLRETQQTEVQMRLSEAREREARREGEMEREGQLGAAWPAHPRRAFVVELLVRFEWHEGP